MTTNESICLRCMDYYESITLICSYCQTSCCIECAKKNYLLGGEILSCPDCGEILINPITEIVSN